MRLLFRKDDQLHVFRFGPTTNKKICSNKREKILQTYVFSLEQFDYVANGGGSLREFFDLANSNCIDCPMRDYGKCYTHKYTQARGFFSMLKSIAQVYDNSSKLPELNKQIEEDLVMLSTDNYVRFGTYGEPVLHGYSLVADMCSVAKTWTGYTHQWRVHPEFNRFFMASVHSPTMEGVARKEGWKSFASLSSPTKSLVNCPASKEAGFKASCDKCGLCSGMLGKGKKSIYILEH